MMNNFDLIRVCSLVVGFVNLVLINLCLIIWVIVPIKGLLLKFWRVMIYAAPIFTFACGVFISYLGCLNITNFLLSVFAWMLLSFFLFAMVNISDKKLYGEEISNSDIFNKLFKSCCCELNPEEQAKLGKALTILII